MACFLGIDTSNYTTSAALYYEPKGPETGRPGEVRMEKRLLPVEKGKLGLRQSDAVFAHVKALGGIMERVFADRGERPRAVGVSVSPRDEKGSYMPCFLAGEMAARSVGAALGAPVYSFSHQAGHIAAALYSAYRLSLFERPFLAFHVSGGTTECLRVRPGEGKPFDIEVTGRTLDLNAGQAVDRIGAMLGLPFPAGPELERLALESECAYSPRVTFRGRDCCLSGMENRAASLLEGGEEPRNIARWTLDYLARVILTMTERCLELHPGLPLIYAGGVMSNSLIRDAVRARYGCGFAEPAYSADNAAGIAVLCARQHGGC